MEARTNLLDTVGFHRQRIEEAFAACERQQSAGCPTLRTYLEDWLSDLKGSTGGGGDESDPELPEANASAAHHRRRASDDRYSIKSEELDNSSNGRRRSLNWVPPAQVNRGSPPLEPDYSAAPPPPPEMSEYHAVNLPVTLSLLLAQVNPLLNKDQLREELTEITTQNPDVDATMAAVKDYVESQGFIMEKLDESFDKWKTLRQSSFRYLLLVMRLYLVDKNAPCRPGLPSNAHYYDHHALAYHAKFFRDHNTSSHDAFLVSSKAVSTQEFAERAYDNFFRSGRYKNHSAYKHCALLHAYEIILQESAKRKVEEEFLSPAKRSRINVEEWSGGAKVEAMKSVFKTGGFVPISGEYTAIPDAVAIVLNRLNVNTDDMPKSLNHDHWLESVKKYMKMPMTRYLNSKGFKLWSLPQGTLNNHLNILRQKEGNIIVVLSLHFMDDKHGPVPRKTHAIVWLAKERLLIDHSARHSPTCVIERDLKSDFTAKRVFDAILQQQAHVGNKVFSGSVVRSAYEIQPMKEADIQKYKDDLVAKAKLAEEKKRVAEHMNILKGATG